MLPQTFRIGMLNAVRTGAYDQLPLDGAEGSEWLEVERSGDQGQILMVSDTFQQVPASPVGAAPAVLTARNTFVAILAKAVTSDRLRFLVVRRLPESVTVPGRYFPSDGWFELTRDTDVIRLSGTGRFALNTNVSAEFEDSCAGPPTAQLSKSWDFDAVQHPQSQPT